jgi:hypothetical protein
MRSIHFEEVSRREWSGRPEERLRKKTEEVGIPSECVPLVWRYVLVLILISKRKSELRYKQYKQAKPQTSKKI